MVPLMFFSLNKSELLSLDFVINRLFVKLFKTNILTRLNFFYTSFCIMGETRP